MWWGEKRILKEAWRSTKERWTIEYNLDIILWTMVRDRAVKLTWWKKEKIRDVLEARFIYDFDRIAGELGGRIDGKLSKKGKKVEPQVFMISGIAIRENEEIITSDTKHFKWISDVSDLNIEDYKSE